MRLFCGFVSVLLFLAPSANGEQVSDRVKSAAFLDVVASRGLECNLLRPWQASALRALNQRDMENWEAERRAALQPEIARLQSETDCENEAMNAWINGASKGFDREMLPPYLVAYRTVARMNGPPKAFTSVALRSDFAGAIATIDMKLAELEASGVIPEGGKPWPDYIERTEGFVEGFIATLASEDTTGTEADQAAAFLAQSALVIEQWLRDEE